MYDTPTIADLNRKLRDLIHESRRRAEAEQARLVGEERRHGLRNSTTVVLKTIEAFDAIHREAIERAAPMLNDIGARIGIPAKDVVNAAKPALEQFGTALLLGLPASGIDDLKERTQGQYSIVFQQRLDGALRDLEMGFVGDRSVAGAEDTAQQQAARLLRIIYDRTKGKKEPMFAGDGATDAGLSVEQAEAAWRYLRDRGLIDTFELEGSARINAKGVDAIEGEGSMQQNRQQPQRSNKIFIVHGHDGEARETVARFLESVGLVPIILHEQANKGRTIIEKVEANSDVSFAVVLLTPDDEGCAKGGVSEPRARQNVLLELGYFIGRLGRDRVCALKRGMLEIPSDFAGVVWEPMDASNGWKQALGRELEAAGHTIDWNKVMRG